VAPAVAAGSGLNEGAKATKREHTPAPSGTILDGVACLGYRE
jgi:hypothetical protein